MHQHALPGLQAIDHPLRFGDDLSDVHALRTFALLRSAIGRRQRPAILIFRQIEHRVNIGPLIGLMFHAADEQPPLKRPAIQVDRDRIAAIALVQPLRFGDQAARAAAAAATSRVSSRSTQPLPVRSSLHTVARRKQQTTARIGVIQQQAVFHIVRTAPAQHPFQ